MRPVHPRRSVLYLPASNERALEKAKGLPVDSLVFDLEDAVAPEAKATARELACAAVRSGAYGMRELAVRVNAAGTEWHDEDLRAVCAAGPDAVVLPKVGSAAEVQQVVATMDAHGAAPATALWAMVETPQAVLRAAEIGAASPRLTVLVLGTNDLLKELGAHAIPGRRPLAVALGMVVLGARAVGVDVLDGVFNDVRDEEGFAAECREGRELGFDGKTLIHPSQVGTANRVFAPSAEEVEDAERTVAAFESTRAEGRAVATVDGRLVEELHVEVARRTLDLHAAVTSATPQRP